MRSLNLIAGIIFLSPTLPRRVLLACNIVQLANDVHARDISLDGSRAVLAFACNLITA